MLQSFQEHLQINEEFHINLSSYIIYIIIIYNIYIYVYIYIYNSLYETNVISLKISIHVFKHERILLITLFVYQLNIIVRNLLIIIAIYEY